MLKIKGLQEAKMLEMDKTELNIKVLLTISSTLGLLVFKSIQTEATESLRTIFKSSKMKHLTTPEIHLDKYLIIKPEEYS
jgi:hypothetical protein